MKERFENPISVSEYISFINELLKKVRVKIIGEVSQLKIHASSGHVYFNLKDKDGGSVVNCVIWKSVYSMFGLSLKEGMEVILSGYSDIYPARGSLTFKVESFEPVGEGVLKRAYDELKEKLEKEGVFDKERKRAIPEYPEKIGIITSLRSGTVIHDFMNNLGKFGFKIKAMDSRVEGQEAVKNLIDCIKSFRNEDIDVLVVIRGGGSLESMMAFDNEVLVREIIRFPVPVIAGIGHHKDITLASLAADAAESTPSAAAHFLNKSWEKAFYKVESGEYRIITGFQSFVQSVQNKLGSSLSLITEAFDSIFKEYARAEKRIGAGIYKMEYCISSTKKDVGKISESIAESFRLTVIENEKSLRLLWSSMKDGLSFLEQKTSEEMSGLQKIIFQNDPERQLKMGYSIARLQGKVIKSTVNLKKGDVLEIKFSDGTTESEIKKINLKT